MAAFDERRGMGGSLRDLAGMPRDDKVHWDQWNDQEAKEFVLKMVTDIAEDECFNPDCDMTWMLVDCQGEDGGFICDNMLQVQFILANHKCRRPEDLVEFCGHFAYEAKRAKHYCTKMEFENIKRFEMNQEQQGEECGVVKKLRICSGDQQCKNFWALLWITQEHRCFQLKRGSQKQWALEHAAKIMQAWRRDLFGE